MRLLAPVVVVLGSGTSASLTAGARISTTSRTELTPTAPWLLVAAGIAVRLRLRRR